MKHLSEETIDYMHNIWGFRNSPHVDDLTMFWESDYPELTALRLVQAGAVDPVCAEAKEMIRVSKSITRKEELKIIDELLKKYTILECSRCNYTHFVPEYLDKNDWINGSCDGCATKNNVKEK